MLFSNVMSDTSVILCTIVAWICTRDATICLKSIMPKQIFTETQNLHNFEEKKNSTFSRIFFSSCLPWCIKRAAHRSIFTTHIKRNMNIFTFFFFCLFFPLASNSLEKYLAFFACVARFFVKKPSDYSPKTMNGEWMLFAEFSVYSRCQNRPLLVDDIGISLMAIFHA